MMRGKENIIVNKVRKEKQLMENDHNYLFDHLPEELVSYMEEVRLGKREL